MKKLWVLLKYHFLGDFSWPYYLSVALFLVSGIIINYFWIDLETVIDRSNGRPIRMVWYFLLYGIAYFGGLLLTVFFQKRSRVLHMKKLWVLSLGGLAVLAISSGFPYLTLILEWFDFDIHIYSWVFSVSVNAINAALVCLPLFLIYQFARASKGERLGLSPKGYDVKPYFVLLLLLLPLIGIASFESGFSRSYPVYQSNSVAEVLNTPSWLPMVTFEFFYGMDFFNVELLFRGFLVIGLSQVLGKDAIMPMVTTYCFLHFGKPIGETISSIIGGYVLGVFAFYTRGIWGGVIIHIGIAWAMELAAYLQKVFL